MQTKRNTSEYVQKNHEASLYSQQGIWFPFVFRFAMLFSYEENTYFNKQDLWFNIMVIQL